jgi:hypothetical protein
MPASFMGMGMILAAAEDAERLFHHKEGRKSNKYA